MGRVFFPKETFFGTLDLHETAKWNIRAKTYPCQSVTLKYAHGIFQNNSPWHLFRGLITFWRKKYYLRCPRSHAEQHVFDTCLMMFECFSLCFLAGVNENIRIFNWALKNANARNTTWVGGVVIGGWSEVIYIRTRPDVIKKESLV